MPVTYSTVAENARLQAVVNTIDANGASGVLRLLDINGIVLSSLVLAFPSATVSGGVITFNGMPLVDGSAANSGTAVTARIDDAAGNTVISNLTVAAVGGADILLTPTNVIAAGQAVSFQSGSITGN